MNIITTTQARANLYRLVDEVTELHTPIVITGKLHNAVLVALSDWESMQETLYLMSIPGMRESIIEGLNAPDDEYFKELDW